MTPLRLPVLAQLLAHHVREHGPLHEPAVRRLVHERAPGRADAAIQRAIDDGLVRRIDHDEDEPTTTMLPPASPFCARVERAPRPPVSLAPAGARASVLRDLGAITPPRVRRRADESRPSLEARGAGLVR